MPIRILESCDTPQRFSKPKASFLREQENPKPHGFPFNSVSQEVSNRAGFTDPKLKDRVDWIVDKYDVKSADDYPAAVRRHNSKGLALIGGFVGGLSAFMLSGAAFVAGIGAPYTKFIAFGGAAVAGLTGAMLERGFEHKSFN
jgi:hypothetical protein